MECNEIIYGKNCAHELSRLEGWKNKVGCLYECSCKYPTMAKQMEDNIFKERGYIDSNKDSTSNAYIYCETEGGQGHVYYGTYSICVRGNNLPASNMNSCKIFNRYS